MLCALPDHQVMEHLLPGIEKRYLPVAGALERILGQPGFVPVAVNPVRGGLVYFADIGDAPFLEWKYIYTIERLARENAIGETFCTDLAILEERDLGRDGMAPDGLIFHVSRCGSTVFTKALARSSRNLIINQGGPLQQGFWAAITWHWRRKPACDARKIRMLRNLVLLMARKRRPGYQRCFVKFISWNIIHVDFIRAAFPTVPMLYLYRDPVEVIATVPRETTAVLRAKGLPLSRMLTGLPERFTATMPDVEYLVHCYAHYFTIVLKAAGALGLRAVNYRWLKQSACLADILAAGLDLRPPALELARMREQYCWFSKDHSNHTFYTGDDDVLPETLSRSDRQVIEEICDEALKRLDRSSCNIFPAAGTPRPRAISNQYLNVSGPGDIHRPAWREMEAN